MKALIFLLATITACAADLYPIARAVVESGQNTPIARAQVYVLRTGTTVVVANLVTGADGKFRFDLPQGKYNVYGGPRDLPQQYGLPTPRGNVGSSIITGPSQDTSHLTLRWFPRCVIAGKVTDENGDPVESATVEVIGVSVAGGRKTMRIEDRTHSNDLGEYRFSSLPGGSYYLTVSAEPWYSKPAFGGGTDSPASAFAPVHYPNTKDVARAAPLILQPGQEAQINFTLTATFGAAVQVRINGANNVKGAIYLTQAGVGGLDSYQQQGTLAVNQAQYSFTGVPPGHYVVKVFHAAGAHELEGFKAADVAASDLSVEVTLQPVATVHGVVVFPASVRRPPGTLLVNLIRENHSSTVSAAVSPDGRFTITRFTGSKYRPTLTLSAAGGYYAAKIEVEGAPFHDGVVDLPDGTNATMRITAGDDPGHVKGFVKRGDKPAEGVMVVLAARTPTLDAAFYRGFLTDSDGSYDLATVRPGDYLLFATGDTEIEYESLAAIQPYTGAGLPIRVEPRGTVEKDLTPVQPPPAK